ncbi:trafficking protein particle complex subunit 1, partial [Guillardia theta CCMP2712]
RNGVCLYYEDWHRVKRPKNLPEEQKLIFGLLFSLKGFLELFSRTGRAPKLQVCLLLCSRVEVMGIFSPCCSTSTYKLHYYETPTGLRFILITDPPVPSLRECLRQIYSHIYVEYVTKNPL